eukprot:scaffold11109_cov123-Isochrysis_galbana.AAC.2
MRKPAADVAPRASDKDERSVVVTEPGLVLLVQPANLVPVRVVHPLHLGLEGGKVGFVGREHRDSPAHHHVEGDPLWDEGAPPASEEGGRDPQVGAGPGGGSARQQRHGLHRVELAKDEQGRGRHLDTVEVGGIRRLDTGGAEDQGGGVGGRHPVLDGQPDETGACLNPDVAGGGAEGVGFVKAAREDDEGNALA